MIRLVLIGAGGHARVVLAAARTMPGVDVVAATDLAPAEARISVPVVGQDALERLRLEGATHAVITVGSVRPGSRRGALFALIERAGLLPLAVMHASATIATDATIGAGTVVLAGAIVNPGAAIGRNAIVNTGAIVEHDCEIADHVHVAPRVVLGGGVRVGEDAHIGIGATVLPGIRIGGAALIGAGAVVTKDVEPRQTVVGVPARAR